MNEIAGLALDCVPADAVGLSSHEVCALARISYRQCDWWLRAGFITAEGDGCGSGMIRVFTLEQTRRVILLGWLVAGGVPIRQAVRLLDASEGPTVAALLFGPSA